MVNRAIMKKPTLLGQAVRHAGGVAKVAKDLGITRQSVYWYLNNRRAPSDFFLDHLGLERVIVYKRKRSR